MTPPLPPPLPTGPALNPPATPMPVQHPGHAPMASIQDPPLATPVMIDYHRRPPTKPSDPGYWSRFSVGVLMGPALVLIVLCGWWLAYVSMMDHYLDRPPEALGMTIHVIGALVVIGVIVWLIWLLQRPVMRPWVWGGLAGIIFVPTLLVLVPMGIRMLVRFV